MGSKIAVAGQYGPVAEARHGYDERVDVESICRITKSIALFVAEWCGVAEAPLNFRANSPTRTRDHDRFGFLYVSRP